MIRIALCDDDRAAVPVIAGAARSAFEALEPVALDTYINGTELLRAMETTTYDLILLDIDMPGPDGIEVGKRIKNRSEDIPVVFVSECEARVFESFSVQPLGFVRKSNFLSDITAVVDLFERYRRRTQNGSTVQFTSRASLISLPVAQIRYVESSRNYQMIFQVGQAEPVEVKMTMEKLQEIMKPHGFIRIHKGYLVNFRFIRRIDTNALQLTDGTELPIGRSKAAEVRAAYLALIG